MKRIILILPIIVLLISPTAYANTLLDKLSRAIKKQVPEIQLQELKKENKGEKISGRGFVREIKELDDGQIVLYLKIDRQFPPVTVEIFLRPESYTAARRLNKNHWVSFIGTFVDVAKTRIIVKDGTFYK